MAKKKKRISRKEQERRKKISRSLKRHYRKEQIRRKKISIALKKFYKKKYRKPAKRKAKPTKKKAKRERKEILDRPRIAFYAKEQLQEQGGVQDKLEGTEGQELKADIKYSYYDKDTEEVVEIDRTVTFESSEDEEEFWRRFHREVREEMEDLIEDFDEEGVDYDSLEVVAVSIR